ncbi:MAG TPA: D-alanyl-D-alanine carboxypeptidase family protein [Solirubrobacterales bacterium]|nr:D-alanyl-D-alanine carboxypeptidase family protein [Solirubrobacterales bacterium]
MRRRRAGAFAVLLAALALWLVPAAGAAAPADGPQGLYAKSWIVVEGNSGDVLASHAAGRRLPIASTTKLMTAYVAMRELQLDDVVRAAPYSPIYGESLLGLKTGEKISVRDLLYGLILVSGNDAAHTLAVAAAGSQPRFVRQMNRYAAALGLADTHYANPIGLDQRGNYSSAADLATLARRLLREPAFARIADSETALLRSLRPPRRIETLNDLLYIAPWATGVKTGHTFDAGYVLVGSGRKKGVELVSVALGDPTEETRFSDNLALLEWGFSQYRRRLPVKAGEELAEPEIRYSGGRLPLQASRSLQVGVRRGQRVVVHLRAPQEVEGPIRRGERLGGATVLVDGRRVGAVALRASRSVPEASRFDRARTFVADNSLPIAIAIFVILMIALVLLRLRARGNESRSRTG